MGEKLLKGMDDELRKMFVREENLDMSRLQVSCSSISTPCSQRCGCSYGDLPTFDACIFCSGTSYRHLSSNAICQAGSFGQAPTVNCYLC